MRIYIKGNNPTKMKILRVEEQGERMWISLECTEVNFISQMEEWRWRIRSISVLLNQKYAESWKYKAKILSPDLLLGATSVVPQQNFYWNANNHLALCIKFCITLNEMKGQIHIAHYSVLIKNNGKFQIKKGDTVPMDNISRNKCFLNLKYS